MGDRRNRESGGLHTLVEGKVSSLTHSDSDNYDDARSLLKTKHSVVVEGAGSTPSDKQLVEMAHIEGILFPWMASYKIFWGLTVVGAIVTVFFEPFQIAFEERPGSFGLDDTSTMVELALTLIFAIDIGVNFNLAFYEQEVIVFERSEIAKQYLKRMFWVDLVGLFPFQTIALISCGVLGTSGRSALLLSLLRLLRFVRLHRMKKFSEILQYNARISLLWFTLLRNLAAVLFTTHLSACTMYLLARLNDFDDNTWLGPEAQHMSTPQLYVTSLYWSVVTFVTVGYGDIAPVNSMEQTACVIFMLFFVVVAAWIIGSITLLVVKNDEKTGNYRDTLQTLHQYSQMHQFDAEFEESLKTQLRLEHNNYEVADENILKHFPSSIRRKILRKLYLPSLVKTTLMKGLRQRFVDAFLASCTVEIFSPGADMVERGSIVSDLFLLVGGVAEVTSHSFGGEFDEQLKSRKFEAGDFIGEIGFFTDSPQIDTMTCVTVCKTLTMSQSTYKLLAQDHPGSAGKILQNLLAKVEQMKVQLPKSLSILRAGSVFDFEASYGAVDDEALGRPIESSFGTEALTAIKDLVKMHMSKQLDDQTTRFCFAASRGDTSTISLMCDQGFDPNNTDYDSRSALMVASMKGNTDVVKMLLEYKADPNLTDMHGSTALLEAVKNGHTNTMKLLFKYNAQLCMSESLAASVLCQAVSDGEISLLSRLLDAGIQVNAADYDKRTAAHIAAAEGNVAAIRVLAERGASLTLKDRWGNTVQDEAKRSNARQLMEFLKKRGQQGGVQEEKRHS